MEGKSREELRHEALHEHPGEELRADDPRFRVKPYQQMAASCTGAFATSLIS